MPHPHQRKLLALAATAFVVGAALVAGAVRFRQRGAELRHELMKEAERAAAGFDRDQLRLLAGDDTDRESPVRAWISDRLRRLQGIDPQVRAVRIWRGGLPDKQLVLLGSSDPAEQARPGMSLADVSVGITTVLNSGVPAVDESSTDARGILATGYAVVGNPAAGETREVLGLTVAAESWIGHQWRGAIQAGSWTLILLAVPFAGWFVRKRIAERAEAVRNLSEAMERSRSAIMIVDLDSHIEYANAALCDQIGYSRRELIGRRWRDFQVPDLPADMLTDIRVLAAASQPWTGQWSNLRKNGSVYPVRGTVSPVKHRDGSASCFVVEFEDLTSMKDTEAELREAKERAEAGDRAKGQFLATMSHEVRTPLNGIVGFTSLLLDMPLAPEQREYVQTIRVSAEALVNLTGDILDFARIESGKLTLDPQPCDPRECVEDALDLLAGLAARKHLELLHWIEDDVPPVIVADGGRLRQVLVNLVNNAVKFTAAGEISVRVRTRAGGSAVSAPEGGLVEIEFSVEDTGIGISRDQHDRLFKPFSQVDASTTRRFGGTGLGLVISKTLVEMMGGDISFVSEPGRGSTFTFTIRCAEYAEGKESIVPARAGQGLEGWKLAVVTRSDGLRAELARLASRWGASVVNADYASLPTSTFDLALVDVDESLVQHLVMVPPEPARLLPQKLFGLVPVSLPTVERQELRAHFRLLVNKPLHHAALLNLLLGMPSGTRRNSGAPFGSKPPFAARS